MSLQAHNDLPKTFPQKEIVSTQGSATVVLGMQWGDEGKGKIVDILSMSHTIIARCQGGANAGHTIVANGRTYKFHLIPSGALNVDARVVIGNGVFLDLPALVEEIHTIDPDGSLRLQERILISDRCHLVMSYHKIIDKCREEERAGAKLGTTGKGIGPCASDKFSRDGIQISDLNFASTFIHKVGENVMNAKKRYGFDLDNTTLNNEIAENMRIHEMLKGQIIDTSEFLCRQTNILVEGANAAMLDIDFGTYPYVTSSNATIGGVITGLGIPHQMLDQVVGVVKAYTTRVGLGPFPTECMEDGVMTETGLHLVTIGREVGTTTGRQRRCGHLDLPVVKCAIRINGPTDINLTKLDVLTGLKQIRVCTHYEDEAGNQTSSIPACRFAFGKLKPVYKDFPGWTADISECKKINELPQEAQDYVKFIEESLGKPISWVGVGPDREHIATP